MQVDRIAEQISQELRGLLDVSDLISVQQSAFQRLYDLSLAQTKE